jgi:HD-GYP domain-containing protein (c-di-GMP phosphodiesterase class II)
MNPINNNDNPQEGIVDIRHLKAGYRFSLDVFDKDNNLILEAHTPISEGVLNHLRSSGINQLYFDPSKMINRENGPVQKLIISDELINEAYDHTKNILDEMRETFTRAPGDGISKGLIDKSRTLVDKIITETDKNSDGVFDVVTKLKDMDDFYYQHSMNVAIIASILGSRLDFKPELRSAMGVGGLFHDIGFSSVSKEILNKAKLNDEEFDIIKSHTHVGYKFVEKNPRLHDIEKRILLLHHERADGEGYPYGFDMDHYQNTIPREVRLLGLIDAFIVLTIPKPGENGMTPREAMRFMVNMIHASYKTSYAFLPADVRDFLRALGFIINKGEPFMVPGDLVRTNNGEIGIVEEMNKLYPLNPKVRIIKNNKMETMKRPITIDLLKSYKDYISNIYDRNSSGKFSVNKQDTVNRT